MMHLKINSKYFNMSKIATSLRFELINLKIVYFKFLFLIKLKTVINKSYKTSYISKTSINR